MRPMALVVGIGFVLTLLGGVVFAIKLYRVGITVKEAKGIAKTVTTQPLSCFRSILRQSPQDQVAAMGPTSQDSPGDIGTRPSLREELDLHPIRMRDILQTVLQDERTGIKYGKYLDRQVRRQGSGEHSHPHPKCRSWRCLESPAETPVCKIVANSQASCQVHGGCHRIRPIHPIQLHTLPKGDQTGVY